MAVALERSDLQHETGKTSTEVLDNTQRRQRERVEVKKRNGWRNLFLTENLFGLTAVAGLGVVFQQLFDTGRNILDFAKTHGVNFDLLKDTHDHLKNEANIKMFNDQFNHFSHDSNNIIQMQHFVDNHLPTIQLGEGMIGLGILGVLLTAAAGLAYGTYRGAKHVAGTA